MQQEYRTGLKAGIPIALGYFAVSFTFGILGSIYGLEPWQTTVISLTNLTSAGQFAGLSVMASAGSFFEMALTQLVINLRYALMGITLTQKLDSKFKGIFRIILGAFITDEIFAVAAVRGKPVTRVYFVGLITLPYIGWGAGTFLGAVMGDVLPGIVVTSLGIALYGMFTALVIPAMRSDRHIGVVVFIAVGISLALYYIPGLNAISSGFAVIICTVAASVIGAVVFPIPDEDENTKEAAG